MTRRAVLVLMVVFGVLAVPAIAGAQYQPGNPNMVLIPSEVEVGGSTTASGFGCRPGTTVVISIDGTTVATTTAASDSTGSFQATFKVPTTPGLYIVQSDCDGILSSRPLTVFLTPTTTVAPTVIATTLPQTGGGAGSLGLARYGLVLLVAGGLVVLAVRRRRATV